MQIYEMEKLLENEKLESRNLTYLQFGFETKINASKTTIIRMINSLNYYKCFIY